MIIYSFNFVQPFSSNNQINAAGYTYDAAGDLKTDALGNTYAYNAEGMLSSTNSAQYTYDALDQRVEKTGGSYPTETIYFQGKPIALLNATSGAWTDLIWAGGGLIAEVAGTQTALPSYRLLDHEGSLVMTTDGSGNVTGTNILSPYGETLSSNTNDAFSYAGLTQDTEYGGHAATFRNYSTEQVRWTRPDPYDGSYDMSNPQTMNRYTYARNNPLNNIDPSGLMVMVCDENGSCGWISDSQYQAAQGADGYNNAPPLGSTGNIYDSDGNIVGTAQYFADGNIDGSTAGYDGLVGGTGGTVSFSSFATNNYSQQRTTQQPQHTLSCGGSLAVLGIGVVTTGAVVGGLIYAPELEPEIYEGGEGLLTILHLTVPVGPPLMVLEQGAEASWQNCH